MKTRLTLFIIVISLIFNVIHFQQYEQTHVVCYDIVEKILSDEGDYNERYLILRNKQTHEIKQFKVTLETYYSYNDYVCFDEIYYTYKYADTIILLSVIMIITLIGCIVVHFFKEKVL